MRMMGQNCIELILKDKFMVINEKSGEYPLSKIKDNINKIAILSLINWLPFIIISTASTVQLIHIIFLLLVFISPFLSLIYLGMSFRFIFKLRSKYVKSLLIISINLLYMFWGFWKSISFFGGF